MFVNKHQIICKRWKEETETTCKPSHCCHFCLGESSATPLSLSSSHRWSTPLASSPLRPGPVDGVPRPGHSSAQPHTCSSNTSASPWSVSGELHRATRAPLGTEVRLRCTEHRNKQHRVSAPPGQYCPISELPPAFLSSAPAASSQVFLR